MRGRNIRPASGLRQARQEMGAIRTMGEAAGDAIVQALTLIDALVVIGGGVSGAAPLFMPALVSASSGLYQNPGRPAPPPVFRGIQY